MKNREYTPLDHLILGLDRVVNASNTGSRRPSPAGELPDVPMRRSETRHSAALMRVNHAGEVAAQALYTGHAVTAKDAAVRESMLQAAADESDHLYWCESRVRELGSHVSYLTPVWYFGSFAIGALAGSSGEKWNLGFVMETERQVVEHLDRHLALLPEHDRKSRTILQQMRADELQHASTAQAAGAAELPRPLRFIMRCCAKVMTDEGNFYGG